MIQPRDDKKRFTSQYNEPRAEKPIALRLPASLDLKLRAVCGDDSAAIRAFVERAIAAALENQSNSDGA